MTRRILIALAALAAAACGKESLQATYDKQTTYIENFVAARQKETPEATLVRQDGAYRLTLNDLPEDASPALKQGQRVTLFYGCFLLTSATLNSGNLVSTNIKELADQAKWTLSDESIFEPLTITVDDSLVPGLASGLVGMQAGEAAYILFTGEYGYGNSERGTIPALSALAYYIQIEEIDPHE